MVTVEYKFVQLQPNKYVNIPCQWFRCTTILIHLFSTTNQVKVYRYASLSIRALASNSFLQSGSM